MPCCALCEVYVVQRPKNMFIKINTVYFIISNLKL